MFYKNFFATLLLLIAVSISQTFAQSPTAAARRFNIFVSGNATLKTNEAEGPIAIGGDLNSNQYQVSFESKNGVFFVGNASIGLAVRGGVKLNDGSLTINGNNYLKIGQCSPSSSSVNNLKVWYKDNNNAESTIRITDTDKQYWETPNITINANVNTWTPKVGETVNPVCENVFGTGDNQIDMDGAFTKMVQRSGHLAALTDNLAIRDQNGNIMQNAPVGPYLDPSVIGNNPKIIVDPTKINVLTVSAAVWNSISNSNIEKIPQGPSLGQVEYTGGFGLVINIVDFPAFAATHSNTIKFPSVGGLSDPQGSYVIYNFVDATGSITLSGNTPIHGTIFAPQADVIKENNGNINGQIIAKSFVQTHDEIHFWPFLPSIPEPVVPVDKKIIVTAQSKCFQNAPYLDYTVTPNFDSDGLTAKIEWINSDGTVVREDDNKAMNGSILFPGATVGDDGNGKTWPGYTLDAGKPVTVDDLNATILKPGAQVRITVVVTSATVSIEYPASTSSCLTKPVDPTLPVTLASFTAKNESCDVKLNWKVTEAKDFSNFEVERSTDAKNFISLSTINYVEGKKLYAYSDSPFSTETSPAKHYYYRLKQVDNDNTFEYSSIRSVESGTCDARLSVSFYPNPTVDEVNVKSFSPVKMMEIVSGNGSRVYQEFPSHNETDLNVNVQTLSQGLYIVNIVNGEGKYSSKILKK